MVLQRLCQCLVQMAVNDHDTAEERRRKNVWIPLQVVWLIVVLMFEIVFAEAMSEAPVQAATLAAHCVLLCSAVGLLYPVVTRRLPLGFVGLMTLLLGAFLLLADLTFAAEKDTFRPWTLIVLLMDLYLSFGVGRVYQRITLHSTALWLMVTSLEDSFRQGLYDVDGLVPGAREAVTNYCDCADPPCAAGAGYFALVALPLMVLYCDFVATRGFAEGLRSEQAKVLASVVTAEQVAERLAGFDLAAAGAALHKAEGELPNRLSLSFGRLLYNLGSYRPYLPQSCFEGDDEPEASRCSTEVESLCSPRSSPIDAARGDAATPEPRREPTGPRRERTSVSAGLAESADEHSSSAVAGLHHHAQQERRVTMLVRNGCDFLAAALEESEAVQLWLAAEIQRFTEEVSRQGGVSDLLSGDHFTAVFGAVKAQGSQCTAATEAAKHLADPEGGAGERFAELRFTATACSGRALCGDFGNALTQRFMVLGGVSSFAVAAERAAAAWRLSVLVDAAVHADVEQLWTCRLRKWAVFPKLGPRPTALWEVLDERRGDGALDEWMYELQAMPGNPWTEYNAAVLQWCAGAAPSEVLAAVAGGLDKSPGGAVTDGLLALRQAIRDGAPPPVGDFTASAFAGDPSPLLPQRPGSPAQPPRSPTARGRQHSLVLPLSA